MRELSRKIVVLVSAIFLSISMISASFADGHGKKILFSIKGPGSGNPFWASVTKGAEEEAKKLGVKLILVAPPQEGDVQAQINQVEDQLAKGVDALALAPGDPNAFAPIVDDAIKSGVPVVFVDTKGKITVWGDPCNAEWIAEKVVNHINDNLKIENPFSDDNKVKTDPDPRIKAEGKAGQSVEMGVIFIMSSNFLAEPGSEWIVGTCFKSPCVAAGNNELTSLYR